MAVLAARGTELETDYPFGVVRQCLEPALRAADRAHREASLAGAAALAAPVLLDTPSDGASASFGVLHGLYWCVANLADQGPVLLVVDDAHWADEPSLRFTAYLARRIESLHATLIVAARPGEPADGTPGFLAELVAEPSCELLTLSALGEPAVAELLGERAAGPVDAAFASACHQASGGNPFLLAELGRALHEQGVPFTRRGCRPCRRDHTTPSCAGDARPARPSRCARPGARTGDCRARRHRTA